MPSPFFCWERTMRGSDFQNLPLSFLIPWPALVLIIVGIGAIACALGLGAWWGISHLQWVP